MDTVGSKKNLTEEKGKLKQKFASLTDNHRLFEEGQKEELFGKHEVRLYQTKEDLQRIISSL